MLVFRRDQFAPITPTENKRDFLTKATVLVVSEVVMTVAGRLSFETALRECVIALNADSTRRAPLVNAWRGGYPESASAVSFAPEGSEVPPAAQGQGGQRCAARVRVELLGRVLGFWLAGITFQATCAVSQEAPVAAVEGPDALGQDQGAGPEGDVLNRQRLLQLMYEVKTAPGTNLDGAAVTTTTDTWRLRGDVTFPLTSQWSVVLRGDLPYLAKDKYTDSNPNGDFLYGLG